MKVLIADDSELVRERLVALISELESVKLVSQASNAGEALMMVRRSRPDVVILDIRMPGVNGLQVLEAIKSTTVKPVIIMLTAFPYPQYRKKCLELGADYFLDKATEFDRVVEVIRQLNGKAAAASELAPSRN